MDKELIKLLEENKRLNEQLDLELHNIQTGKTKIRVPDD